MITTQEICSFRVSGKPVGKMRPRACNRGGSTRVYSPKAQTDYEGMVKILASDAMRVAAVGQSTEPTPTDKPVKALIEVHTARPKAMPKRDRGRVFAVRKPDLDNVCKSILDACNGIVYHDDSQIVELEITRRWGYFDNVDVSFSQISEYSAESNVEKKSEMKSANSKTGDLLI